MTGALGRRQGELAGAGQRRCICRPAKRYAHLSPKYLAGAAGTLDSAFGEARPTDRTGEFGIVTMASPHSGSAEWRPQGDSNPRYRRERAMS